MIALNSNQKFLSVKAYNSIIKKGTIPGDIIALVSGGHVIGFAAWKAAFLVSADRVEIVLENFRKVKPFIPTNY